MAKASDFRNRTMTEDILSQEEVDALLRGVSGEIDESERPEIDAHVRPYDIARQERIVRGHLPGLELVNERFTGLLRAGLYDFMRKDADVSAGPVRALKYSEFVHTLIVPTNLNLVQIKPLKGHALVVFEPALVSQVVEYLFGGQGRFHMREDGWSFTPTELRVIQRMLQVVFEQYQRAWQPVFDVTLEYIRSETHTQFAAIAECQGTREGLRRFDPLWQRGKGAPQQGDDGGAEGSPDAVMFFKRTSVNHCGRLRKTPPYARLEPAVSSAL